MRRFSNLMIDESEARKLAMAELIKKWNIEDDEPVIFDEHTIEKDFGWVFFWTSKNMWKLMITVMP